MNDCQPDTDQSRGEPLDLDVGAYVVHTEHGAGQITTVYDGTAEVRFGADGSPHDCWIAVNLSSKHLEPVNDGDSDPARPDDSTWEPVDIDPVLSGDWIPPYPNVGPTRSDDLSLLYPGKQHTCAGESEAGKSWFALAACQDEINNGNLVLYLDFEDDVGGIVGKLLAMQVDAEALRHRFVYIRPWEPLNNGIKADRLDSLLQSRNPTLVVVDGVTEAMTIHGWDPLNNRDTAEFGQRFIRRLVHRGAALLLLDHVTKDKQGRGRYALGAIHKLNAVDGAAYIIENRKPFGIGLTGRSGVYIAKDRPGQVRRHGLPGRDDLTWIADLVIKSHNEDFVEVDLDVPTERDEAFRPTVTMGRVAAALSEHGPLSKRRIRVAVKGKNTTVDDALELLILDGYVSETTPHELLKPYPPEGAE